MKSRLLMIVLALTCTLGACTRSKKLFSLAIMEARSPIASQPIDLAAYEAEYGEYDGVFLFYEDVVEHAGGKEVGAMTALFNAPASWSYQRLARSKYIVFNPRAEWLTTFSVWTKPDTVILKITNPDGTHREFGVSDLRAEKDDYGGKDYRFIFPNVERGSIIETGYAIEFKVGVVAPPPLEHTISLQHTIPAERVLFTFACPEWWQFEIKRLSEIGTPQVDISDDPATRKSLIKVARRDVPAVKSERYAPYFKEMADYLQFRVTNLTMGGATWDATGSWDEVGEDFYKAALKKLENTTPAVQHQTQIVVGNAEKPLDKLRRILEFAGDSIEIDGRNRDGNPDKVLKDRKADIFDLTALTSAMMKEAGLPNDYLLVHSATDGYCDLNYLSLRQFSFPAVGCKIDTAYYTLFPYMEGLQAGVVPPWLLGQNALGVAKGGVHMVKLPDFQQIPSRSEGTYDLTIQEDGLVRVTEELQLTGATAYLMRDSLGTFARAELEEAVKKMLTYTGGTVDLKSFDVLHLDDPYEPLIVRCEYTLDNLVTITPEEVVFQTAGLFSPISGGKWIDDPAEREHDVVINFPVEYLKTVHLRYPESWTVNTSLEDVETSNDFGLISGRYEHSAGLISVDQKAQLNRLRRPKEEYAAFLEIAGERSSLYIPTIVFTVGQAPSEETPEE
jgi:hypothetical protein